MPTKILLILLLIFSVLKTAAQDDFVIGELYDKKTNEPIPFATIRVKGYAIGVVSNLDGGFKVPLKFKEYGDAIEISSMGYQVLDIDLKDFSLFQNNIIKLEPSLEILSEVILVSKKKKALKAKDIVMKAIQGIQQNYPTTPFSYIGYYRDYQEKNGYRFNLNEAILEVFDNGFQTNDFLETNYKLYQYIKNLGFPRDSTGSKPYDNKNKFIPGASIQTRRGNELLILRNMDALRNYNIDTYSYVYNFERDFLDNHFFRMNKDVRLKNESLYAIAVTKRTEKYFVFGTIYISKASFSIYRFNYEVYKRGTGIGPKSTYETLKKGGNPLFAVRVGYNKHNESMYPSYVSFNNQFTTYGEPKFKPQSVSLDFLDQSVLVGFNNKPSDKGLRKTKNYILRYNEEPIRIRNIKRDGEMIRLYFSALMWEKLEQMISTNKADNHGTINLKITKVEDLDGNMINEPVAINYNQYREFFVQRVNPKNQLYDDFNLMKKDKPIFENKFFDRPIEFSDYWMNTPLQKKKQ